MNQPYFTSDTHFGHKNILKYDNAPFDSIEEHDETIINNWNSVIDNDTPIYFLGDFALCSSEYSESIMQQLNGIKYFIKGNHDDNRIIKLYNKYGTFLGPIHEMRYEGQKIVLCHYAFRVWNKSHKGVWHLYGHSHGSLPEDIHSNSFDVGIMNWDYTPISFGQVQTKMMFKEWKPIDGHIDR